MALSHSPQIATDGLVFAMDTANRKSISPLGCTGFNGAPQLVKNLGSLSTTIDSFGGIKLGNLTYYTIFAIDYPEGSHGGDAAGRHGITPGYDVRSGTKSFGFGRALNYAVWNKDTQTFVKTSVYDSYVGTAAVDTFVAEYNVAVQTWPNAIHIVSGSHRDSFHTAAQYTILRDLGAPNNVNSIIGFSSPEWILVGEPGLGAGNAYGWTFQNYPTNPDRVAHLNLGLPIYGNTGNYLEFDGVDDYIEIPQPSITFSPNKWTICMWLNPNNQYSRFLTPNSAGIDQWLEYDNTNSRVNVKIAQSADTNERTRAGTSNTVPINQWSNFCVSIDGLNIKIYVNGTLTNEYTESVSIANWSGIWRLGQRGNNTNWFSGAISNFSIYDRALSAQEVQQNFNALRGRYGI